MNNDDTWMFLYNKLNKVIDERDLLARKLELVKFVLSHEVNTNGTEWVKDLLSDMEQVGKENVG